jgi:hypothetical protein
VLSPGPFGSSGWFTKGINKAKRFYNSLEGLPSSPFKGVFVAVLLAAIFWGLLAAFLIWILK